MYGVGGNARAGVAEATEQGLECGGVGEALQEIDRTPARVRALRGEAPLEERDEPRPVRMVIQVGTGEGRMGRRSHLGMRMIEQVGQGTGTDENGIGLQQLPEEARADARGKPAAQPLQNRPRTRAAPSAQENARTDEHRWPGGVGQRHPRRLLALISQGEEAGGGLLDDHVSQAPHAGDEFQDEARGTADGGWIEGVQRERVCTRS